MDPAANVEKVLGPLEAAIMKVMWATDQPLSVRDVFQQLNRRRARPLAYTTVMTVMARLAEKGILGRRLVGRSYQYEAVLRDAAAVAVRAVVRDFGPSTVEYFVEEARANPNMLSRLRALTQDEGE
jgi:predicted transcriptional regulator